MIVETIMASGEELAKLKLAELDRWHMKRGDYIDWMLSEDRKHFAGNQIVRVVNSINLAELCQKSGLPEDRVRVAYKESLETGDILFVTYEEPDASSTD